MKIAIVTGASSGIGASYVCQLAEKYSWLDEIWVIARNETALWTLKRQCIVPLRVFAMDITQTENLLRLEEELEKEFKKEDESWQIYGYQERILVMKI